MTLNYSRFSANYVVSVSEIPFPIRSGAMFHNLDVSIPIEICGQWEDERYERELTIQASATTHVLGAPVGWLRSEEDASSATGANVISWMQFRYKYGDGEEINSGARLDAGTGKFDLDCVERHDIIPTRLLPARSYASPARVALEYSSALKEKRHDDVINAIRIIEPAIEGIEVLAEPSGPSISLDLGLDRLVPLAVSGEGMVRLFSIILELIASKDGVLLIDEIDNGLHYSVMPALWKLLGTLALKHCVQVFGTTHNDDIIRSALRSFSDSEGSLGLFRIDKRDNRHVMVAYDEESMEAVLREHFEVRG